MAPEFTDQQGGTFAAETFEETIFEAGTVWRRTEPDSTGWVRQAEASLGGYGQVPYGSGITSEWTAGVSATSAWTRLA